MSCVGPAILYRGAVLCLREDIMGGKETWIYDDSNVLGAAERKEYVQT